MARASEKTILVVDDEPDVRNFLATCLEDAGFNVETAKDGVDALEKVAAHVPDLITLDMVMPRQSGTRVMRELRANEKTAHVPVIVITAHAKDEFGSDEIKELNAFAARLRPKYMMEKPITPQKLVKAIADILEVDPDEADEAGQPSSPDSELLSKLISGADPDTLNRIRALLDKK
ncbi:MAG: response regulator [Deltaproteobacteria bacterium]|nr:response regulator [Deltaproteobacteria bacterium]